MHENAVKNYTVKNYVKNYVVWDLDSWFPKLPEVQLFFIKSKIFILYFRPEKVVCGYRIWWHA